MYEDVWELWILWLFDWAIKCCMEIPYGASGLEHYGGERRDYTPITIQGRPMHFALWQLGQGSPQPPPGAQTGWTVN